MLSAKDNLEEVLETMEHEAEMLYRECKALEKKGYYRAAYDLEIRGNLLTRYITLLKGGAKS